MALGGVIGWGYFWFIIWTKLFWLDGVFLASDELLWELSMVWDTFYLSYSIFVESTAFGSWCW